MPMTLRLSRNETDAAEIPAACDAAAAQTINGRLRALRDFSSRERFARNETLFNEGQRADRIFKIISGTVRLCRHTPDGRRHIADFMLPGDIVGFAEFDTHPFTAEAVTDLTLSAYPRARFEQWDSAGPELRAGLLSHLASTMLATQQQLFVLGCRNAKERFASFLLRMADRTDTPQGERLDLPMGRQDIADHLGLTIETVCRVITSLRGAGLITAPNTHQLILNDVAGLRALAEGIATLAA